MVFERAEWRCEWCGSGEVNLQVHHGYYERDAEPWTYPIEALFCLCDNCHGQAEDNKRAVYREVGLIHPKHQQHVLSVLGQLGSALQEPGAAVDGEVRVERRNQC